VVKEKEEVANKIATKEPVKKETQPTPQERYIMQLIADGKIGCINY